MNFLIPIYIHIPAFLLIYFVLDALHDTWFLRDKNNYWKAKISFGDDRIRFNKLSLKYNRSWHALDAFIKAFVIVNFTYGFYGLDWIVIYWGLFAAFLRWISHDLSWNMFYGLKWSYRGTVAFFDRLKISDVMYFCFKFIGLAISTYLLIINFHY